MDKGIFDKEFIWNSSNCNCECDKSYDVGEYFGYKNCKCKKRLIDKLVEECSGHIDGNEMTHNDFKNSYTIYIVLFVIAFLIIISISSVFI